MVWNPVKGIQKPIFMKEKLLLIKVGIEKRDEWWFSLDTMILAEWRCPTVGLFGHKVVWPLYRAWQHPDYHEYKEKSKKNE